MTTGTVKWFDVKKGFGFIVGPEGQDVFVHFSSIAGDGFKTLKDGEPVEYELIQGDKGFHAREVRRVNGRSAGNGAARETAVMSTAPAAMVSESASSPASAWPGPRVVASVSRLPGCRLPPRLLR